MDILILGGGYGTRLFGEYNRATYIPKGLVNVEEKPCIEHALETFSDNLVNRIILETNREGKHFYEDWVRKSRFRKKTEIYVEEISTPKNCLGVLETIGIVLSNYRFSKPILILSPDNIFTRKQNGLITGYTSGVRIATYGLNSLSDAQKYGVLELNSGKITECIEKPSNPHSKTIRTSCEIWGSEVFSQLSEWNELYDSDKVGDFINFLIKRGIYVESYKTNGSWIDIGNKEDFKKAKLMIETKK